MRGKMASGIIPGVLSSHLDSDRRTFMQANLAFSVRSAKFGEDTVARLVVGVKPDGRLELCMAKEGGKDQPDRFTDLDELLKCINRCSLRPIRADEAPPRLETVTEKFDDVQLDEVVLWAASRQYRAEQHASVNEEVTEQELGAEAPPVRVAELSDIFAERVAKAETAGRMQNADRGSMTSARSGAAAAVATTHLEPSRCRTQAATKMAQVSADGLSTTAPASS